MWEMDAMGCRNAAPRCSWWSTTVQGAHLGSTRPSRGCGSKRWSRCGKACGLSSRDQARGHPGFIAASDVDPWRRGPEKGGFRMLLRSIMNSGTAIGLVVLATVPVSSTAYAADSFAYTGTTTDRPTFNRPDTEDPWRLSGQVVRYHARQFLVDRTTFCTVDSSQEGIPQGGFDGVIHVYQRSFDPNKPSTNVIAANNDFYEESESQAFRVQ